MGSYAFRFSGKRLESMRNSSGCESFKLVFLDRDRTQRKLSMAVLISEMSIVYAESKEGKHLLGVGDVYAVSAACWDIVGTKTEYISENTFREVFPYVMALTPKVWPETTAFDFKYPAGPAGGDPEVNTICPDEVKRFVDFLERRVSWNNFGYRRVYRTVDDIMDLAKKKIYQMCGANEPYGFQKFLDVWRSAFECLDYGDFEPEMVDALLNKSLGVEESLPSILANYMPERMYEKYKMRREKAVLGGLGFVEDLASGEMRPPVRPELKRLASQINK